MGTEDQTPENAVEQSQETAEPPVHVRSSDLTHVSELAEQLIGGLRAIADGDQVAEIVTNAMKLLRDQTNRGDIKLINKSFRELRYALKVFAPYRDVRKVAIFGSRRTAPTAPDYQLAAEFGKKMADSGWMVITGAGGGIMAAGHGGAGADPSFGLAIRLPFEQATNPHIAKDPKLINFNYFFTRKLIFVRSSNAIAVFPGGFGTMDEGFEALTLVQTGKSVPTPIVLIDAPGSTFWQQWQQYVKDRLLGAGLLSPQDLHLYKITQSTDEAVEELRRFYSNYHSVRYSRDELIIRLHRAPDEAMLSRIRTEFADIVSGKPYRVTAALPVERDETALASLPRLAFGFNRRDHGRLRQLIDLLNTF